VEEVRHVRTAGAAGAPDRSHQGLTKLRSCCGANNICGFGPDYCGTGCQSQCDATAPCGRDSAGGSVKCGMDTCCSYYGWCGVSEHAKSTADGTPAHASVDHSRILHGDNTRTLPSRLWKLSSQISVHLRSHRWVSHQKDDRILPGIKCLFPRLQPDQLDHDQD
jgi:hypothetical protein